MIETLSGYPGDEPKRKPLEVAPGMIEFALANPDTDQVPLMLRPDITDRYPITQEQWEVLPPEFKDFVRGNHEARE